MGYSSRYHAASLAAVFLALAIGILIGVGFGDTVVSDTQRNLEGSLKSDLDDARSETGELRGDLGREREFSGRVYPALVGERLRGRRIGLIAIGGLQGELSSDIRRALEPTGARLTAVVVVRAPLNLDSLADALEGGRYERAAEDGRAMGALGERIGRELVVGGRFTRRLRGRVFSRASGGIGMLDAAILVRQRPDDLEVEDKRALDRFENGLVRGVRDAEVPVVAVERGDADRSAVNYFKSREISTVDSVDRAWGRVAMVFALSGAEGAFGVKDGADQLLPELLVPADEPAAAG